MHQAKKRFGQNFLHDAGVIERIVRSIAPQAGDAMVEIGPGLGALSVPLLRILGQLTVVEIDRDIIPHLQQATGHHTGLQLVQADALKVDYATLKPADRKLRIVGNLPYNISTPLLFHLLQFAGDIQDMHFMLQKEVVDRMAAQPGDADYGRLTVTLAARCDVRHLFNVGPGAFKPAPQVDSAIVRLIPRAPAFEITDINLFDRIVTAAFSQRRKTLANGLKALMTKSQIEAAGIHPGIRAEELSAAAFARLTQQLYLDLRNK